MLRFLLAANLACLLPAAAQNREAPNIGVAPVNQLVIAGNACGPAALLNAFRAGDENWRRADTAVPGATDKEKLRHIILKIGMRPSKHLGGRPRWSKSGVNVADLCDMANEITAGQFLPGLGYEVLFLNNREDQPKLLRRVHGRLEKSLSKGFPPVMSIRRFVKRKGQWTVIEGHFVTVTAVSKKIGRDETSFQVSYVDPWGGKKCEGTISVSDRFAGGNDPMLAPCLEAVFPQASVGKGKVAKGEPTFIAVSAAIGRW